MSRITRPRAAAAAMTLALGLVALAPAAHASTEAPANTAATTTSSGTPATIPALRDWTAGSGSLALPAHVRVIVDARSSSAALKNEAMRGEAATLAADLRAMGIDAEAANGADLRPGDIVLVADSSLAEEGYRLEISDRVTISASTTAGLFYGGRTILQMRTASPELPVGTAVDEPGQRMRGGMIDAGRKYWEIDYLKDLIRDMSYQKLNMLNLHLVESEGFRLDSPRFPGLADPANSYDEAEIKDLVAFAADHHVEIIPGFEFPGHATVLSDYFGIGFGTGENPCTAAHMHSHLTPDWVIDMTSDKARADSAAVLEEFLPWFDSEYVHIGGDELPGQLANCPRVQQYIAADPEIGSAGDMLVDYINDLNAVATAHGKRTIIFNGFEHMARSQQTLDPSVVIQDWQGEVTDPAFEGHEKIWENSRYAYLTPNNYHHTSPDLPFLTSTWAPAVRPDMIGSSFAVWADYNMWADDEYFENVMGPLRAAIADRTWNVDARTTVAELDARREVTGSAPGRTGFPERERVGAEQPLHHYAFDPAPYPSGFTWAGSTGQTLFVEDETARLHGSTYIIWNPTFVNDGVNGSALNFTHDREGVGLGGVDLEGPWTMSVWVKPSAVRPDATLLSSDAGTAVLLSDAATGEIAVQSPEGRKTFGATLPVGEWTALALVDDGTSTTLYLDGVAAGTVDSSMALPLKAIGAWKLSLRGSIDELVINDAALSAAQIADRYAEESAGLAAP